MTPADRTSKRQATLSVLGILAIPLVSVSSAAVAAGPISTADPASMAAVVIATLLGALAGLVILRAVQLTIHAVHTAAVAVFDWAEGWSISAPQPPAVRLVALPVSRSTSTHLSGAIHRRGPPRDL